MSLPESLQVTPIGPRLETGRVSLPVILEAQQGELVLEPACRASPAGRTGPGVLAPTLSNLCVNRRPCLAPRGDRGPSELVELRL